MNKSLARTSTALAALLIGAPAAFADVTPKEVWDQWAEQMKSANYTVTATETMQGNDLKISDITLEMALTQAPGQGDIAVTASMPGLTFVDNGDGTVDVQMPSNYPISIQFKEDSGSGSALVNYNTVGLKMTASGTADALSYDTKAASMDISLGELIIDGTAIEIGNLKLNMINVTGTSMITGALLMETDQAFKADQMLIDMNIKNPEAQYEYGKVTGSIQDVTLSSKGAMPKNLNFEDMQELSAAVKQGMMIDFNVAHAGSEIDYDLFLEGDKMVGSQSSGAGNFGMAFDASALRLFADSKDGKATVQVSDLPFPVSYGLGESKMDFMIPLGQSEEEQDFKLALTLGDFTMADMLWGLFDPAGQLPRDPATISFDITGKIKILADIFDEKTLTEDKAPGELNSVALNDLTVRMVGAELTGAGAFTFDNTDLSSFDGLPRPEGSVDLSLTGANKLMDTAVSMGLLGEEDVMGARMMMGMFAVPGEGEDSLKSKIEVNSEGHVLANGMRLQ